MKVCMISGSYPPAKCGIGDHTAHLAMHLARNGVEVDVLTCRGNPVTPSPSELVNVFPVLSSAPALDTAKIALHAAEHRCDLIHLQFPTWAYRRSVSVSLLPSLLRLATRVPSVATFHEVVRSHPVNRLRLVPIACASSAVIATTEEDCRWLRERLPLHRGRVAHVPIGPCVEPVADPSNRNNSRRAECRRQLGLADDDVVICYFGFILRNKMLEDLLAALRNVSESCPRVRLLLMTGFDRTEGSYGAHIRAQVAAMGLADRVIETGYVSPTEASRCFSACDFATLLFRDGASFRRSSLLTAMAHGLPVLSYRSGAAPAGISDGENVLLSPVGDIRALTDNMLRMYRDLPLRLHLSRGALETARRFSWPAIAGQTIELYHTLR